MIMKACMKMLSSRSWWWLPVEVKAAEEEVFLEASCVKMQSPEECKLLVCEEQQESWGIKQSNICINSSNYTGLDTFLLQT